MAHHWQDGIAGTSHRLQVKPKSRIGQLFAQGSPINSFHQQRIKELAPGLVATGLDPRDGTIEAYESRGTKLCLVSNGIQNFCTMIVSNIETCFSI